MNFQNPKGFFFGFMKVLPVQASFFPFVCFRILFMPGEQK